MSTPSALLSLIEEEPTGEQSRSPRQRPMSRKAVLAIYGALAAELGLVAWYAVTFNPFDLNVYLWGGHAVTSDTRLYLAQVARHWFTYPPFAAILFMPVAAIPVVLARVLWELVSIAALAVACVTTLKLAGYRTSRTALVALVAGACGSHGTGKA
jgi:hypothetical protein